ncbi:MAG: ZIP family metal transporter [Deltaproteobacteria bacterium]
MDRIVEITLIGLLSGVIGTGTGGLLAFFINKNSSKLLGFILEFSAGLMLAVVCFDLLPEAFDLGGVSLSCWGVVLGTIIIIILDDAVKRADYVKNSIGNNALLKTGVLMAVGISLHNFPEGIAIGSGFEASIKLGLSIALVIAVHDIPEGMAVAVPLRAAGIKGSRVLFLTILSGLPTAVGAFFGVLLGEISREIIAMCLGFAGGAMIYIVCSELIPEAKRVHSGRLSSIGNMLGILSGIFVSFI